MANVEAAPQPLATCLAFLRAWSTPERKGSQRMGVFFLLRAARTGQELAQCLSGPPFSHEHQFARTPLGVSSVEDIRTTTGELPEEGVPAATTASEAPWPPNPRHVTDQIEIGKEPRRSRST